MFLISLHPLHRWSHRETCNGEKCWMSISGILAWSFDGDWPQLPIFLGLHDCSLSYILHPVSLQSYNCFYGTREHFSYHQVDPRWSLQLGCARDCFILGWAAPGSCDWQRGRYPRMIVQDSFRDSCVFFSALKMLFTVGWIIACFVVHLLTELPVPW